MDKTGKFVIQKHIKLNASVHWDLMFEAGGVLETYRLELPPEQIIHQQTAAVKIFDHPLRFLTYQGSVNKDAGSVEIVESGMFQLISRDDNEKKLQLNGKILNGLFILTFIQDDNWLFGHLG